jgi:hypothetical protein
MLAGGWLGLEEGLRVCTGSMFSLSSFSDLGGCCLRDWARLGILKNFIEFRINNDNIKNLTIERINSY